MRKFLHTLPQTDWYINRIKSGITFGIIRKKESYDHRYKLPVYQRKNKSAPALIAGPR